MSRFLEKLVIAVCFKEVLSSQRHLRGTKAPQALQVSQAQQPAIDFSKLPPQDDGWHGGPPNYSSLEQQDGGPDQGEPPVDFSKLPPQEGLQQAEVQTEETKTDAVDAYGVVVDRVDLVPGQDAPVEDYIGATWYQATSVDGVVQDGINGENFGFGAQLAVYPTGDPDLSVNLGLQIPSSGQVKPYMEVQYEIIQDDFYDKNDPDVNLPPTAFGGDGGVVNQLIGGEDQSLIVGAFVDLTPGTPKEEVVDGALVFGQKLNAGAPAIPAVDSALNSQDWQLTLYADLDNLADNLADGEKSVGGITNDVIGANVRQRVDVTSPAETAAGGQLQMVIQYDLVEPN